MEEGALETFRRETAHRRAEPNRPDWRFEPVRRPYEAACASKEPVRNYCDQAKRFYDRRLTSIVNADDDCCIAERNAMVFEAAKVLKMKTCNQF